MTDRHDEPVEPVEAGEAGEAIEPVQESGPAAAEAVADAAEAGVPSAPAPRHRRIAAVAGAVLLAGAVVAGVGCTVVRVQHADRDAGAPVWRLPEPASGKTRPAAAPQGLAGMLVPYGTHDLSRGPDIGAFGSDAQLSGAQATALFKESLKGLPRTQRKQLEAGIDKQHIQGMAMRSYYTATPRPYGNDEIVAVQITLAQMGSAAAVRDIAAFRSQFFGALDVFRKGPRIKGHKDARCFLPPKDEENKGLDAMYCTASAGNVLVTAVADGLEPLGTEDVAALLAEQLDRIAGQGEAV